MNTNALSPPRATRRSWKAPSRDAQGSRRQAIQMPPRPPLPTERGPLTSQSSDQSNSVAEGEAPAAASESLGQPPTAFRMQLTEQPTLRDRMWAVLDDPSSSTLAYCFAVFVMLMICLSSVAFVVETLPTLSSTDPKIWSTIELVCISIFTAEFSGRLLCCPDQLAFLKAPLNIIDFVAIAPFYLELVFQSPESGGAGGSSAVFRVVRLVRVFRVFKLSRYLSWVKVFAKAMSKSFQPLFMLLLVIFIGATVFSTAIFYAERGDWSAAKGCFIRSDGACSPFSSIPASFWWCIITMTTVGYGDEYPITAPGKIVAVVTALCGVLVLAIPITVISTNFNDEYAKLKKSRQKVKARMMLLKNQFKTKRTGLDAICDEVDEMVQRNTMELRRDVEDMFEQCALELKAELKSLVRLAFRQRYRKAIEAERALLNQAIARRATVQDN
jgi:hypothetical protein